MEWQGSAHTSRRPQRSLPFTSLVLPTARVRFPGPSAPRTCTWAAPPLSGVCYLKPGADLRSGALECFISLLFIASWVASEILFNFSGFWFPQLCDTQWPRRDISLLMKNGVFWMFRLYLEEFTGVGVELGSCLGGDPITLGSQFIFSTRAKTITIEDYTLRRKVSPFLKMKVVKLTFVILSWLLRVKYKCNCQLCQPGC